MYQYYIYVNNNLEDYSNDYCEAWGMYLKAVEDYVEGTYITLVDGETGEVIEDNVFDEELGE